MAQQSEKSTQNYWLYAMIIILALLVIVETVIIYRFRAETQTQDRGQAQQARQEPERFAPQTRLAEEPFVFTGLSRDLFQELNSLQLRLNHFFNLAKSHGTPFMQDLRAAIESDFFPPTDIEESTKAYRIRMDLPGFEKDKVEVRVQNHQVFVRGQRDQTVEERRQDQEIVARERRSGVFARTLTLPGPVKDAETRASYENGVLTITLPKADKPAAAKRIDVQ